MNPMSFSETIFLFFLALIIFGPKKLPEIARQVGKWMNEFRRASNEFKSQIEQEIAHLEVESKQTILPPSRPVEGTASRTLNAIEPEPTSAEAPPVLAASIPESTPASEPTSATNGSGIQPETSEAVPSADPAPNKAEPHSESVTSSTSQETHA